MLHSTTLKFIKFILKLILDYYDYYYYAINFNLHIGSKKNG